MSRTRKFGFGVAAAAITGLAMIAGCAQEKAIMCGDGACTGEKASQSAEKANCCAAAEKASQCTEKANLGAIGEKPAGCCKAKAADSN